MLVHLFVVSCLDYCGTLYHGLPLSRIGSLNRVLRTAARLVGRIPKYGHVSEYMQDELNWLPYPHLIAYRVSSLVKSNQIKYSFINKRDNPPDTDASGFYRRVGGGKNTNN